MLAIKLGHLLNFKKEYISFYYFYYKKNVGHFPSARIGNKLLKKSDRKLINLGYFQWQKKTMNSYQISIFPKFWESKMFRNPLCIANYFSILFLWSTFITITTKNITFIKATEWCWPTTIRTKMLYFIITRTITYRYIVATFLKHFLELSFHHY